MGYIKTLSLLSLVFLGIATSCDKQADLLGDQPVINQEETISTELPTSKLRSFESCSYPYKGEELKGGINTELLSPGKYYYTRRVSNKMDRDKHFTVRLISGGPIVTRSVYENDPWFGKPSYTVYEGCEKLYDSGIRSFSPYEFLDSDQGQKVFYEIIVEEEATVNWNALEL